MSEWISVNDRLPDEGKRVILATLFGIYAGWRRVPKARERSGVWRIEHVWYESGCVSHWQPLPEPPK